ncbi:hypothetical protein DFR30_1392 [Thiogranum longum]|uniref:Uncharacterized protein n=1 Tax=Thiogranum longum TaxID=1537524 RepID=A0A4R1HFL4_9GAMM|nr:hypothetical protein DFR30_1392 [Thiogranum longum]
MCGLVLLQEGFITDETGLPEKKRLPVDAGGRFYRLNTARSL